MKTGRRVFTRFQRYRMRLDTRPGIFYFHGLWWLALPATPTRHLYGPPSWTRALMFFETLREALEELPRRIRSCPV